MNVSEGVAEAINTARFIIALMDDETKENFDTDSIWYQMTTKAICLSEGVKNWKGVLNCIKEMLDDESY